MESTLLTDHLRAFPTYISIFFLLVYFFWFPGGYLGLSLAILASFFALFAVNQVTVAVFLLQFGPAVFGFFFNMFGIVGLGTPFALGLSILLLINNGGIRKEIKGSWFLPLVWAFIVESVMIFSYLYGPQTGYSLSKLLMFSVMLVFFFYSTYVLITHPDSDFYQLGFLCIIMSSILYSGGIFLIPGYKPTTIFELAGMRTFLSDLDAKTILTPLQTVGLMCSTGMILLLGYFSAKTSRRKLIVLVLLTFIALVFLNSVGERQFVLIPIMVLLGTVFLQNKNKGVFLLIFIILALFSTTVVWLGLKSQNQVITKMFATEESFAHRVNRDTNWEAAVRRIEEEPIWGHGLGGYYIDGYSAPGEGAYAHNLLFELLTETGLVGTVSIAGFAILFFLIRYFRKIPKFRTSNGSLLFPLFIGYFLVSMISYDLKSTFRVFSFLLAMWVYVDFLSRPEETPIASEESQEG